MVWSTSDESRIQTARYGGIRSAFDDGATIGKEGELVRLTPEFQDKAVVLHHSMGLEARSHLPEVYRALPLVNLYRVSAAQGNLRASFACEIDITVLIAGRAAGTRMASRNLRPLIAPEVE